MLGCRPMRPWLRIAALAVGVGACGGGQGSAPGADAPAGSGASGENDEASGPAASGTAADIGSETDAAIAGAEGKTETFSDAQTIDALKKKLAQGSLDGVARLDLSGRSLGPALGKLLAG